MTLNDLQIKKICEEIEMLRSEIKIKSARKRYLLHKIYNKRCGQKKRNKPLTSLETLALSRRKVIVAPALIPSSPERRGNTL